MDSDVILLMDKIEKLFTVQTTGINNQLIDIKKQADKTEDKVEEIRKKIEKLINAETLHYIECPINIKVKEIEGQYDEIKFVKKYPRLLQTLDLILEYKVVFLISSVVFALTTFVGITEGVTSFKEYMAKNKQTQEQVIQNTEVIQGIQNKEIKSILKK